MKTWPKLYKLDNKGKVRVWQIDIEQMGNPIIDSGKSNSWCYRQTHGVLGGKLQQTFTTIDAGKNIGKKNETSIGEQCELEAQSLWEKQRDRKGYTETIPSEKPFGPMLAKSYDKDGHHIKFPCYVQPKLDGLRCLAKVEGGKVELRSRQNKVFKVLQHIEDELSQFPDGVYDGELYSHDATFQDIVSGIKRDEKNGLTDKIEYWIYDLINDDTFENRYKQLLVINSYIKNSKSIKLVNTNLCEYPSDIEYFHKEAILSEMEGVMLRNAAGSYKINGRSADLQKYKKFMDEEFEIIGAEENKGKLAGSCVFLCKTKEGGIFKVMPDGSEVQRKKYWTDWNSGKIKSGDLLTVEFFSWTTSTPKVPRFPIGKIIRDYD